MKLTQPRTSHLHGPSHLQTMTDRELTEDTLKIIIGGGPVNRLSYYQTGVLTGRKSDLNNCS